MVGGDNGARHDREWQRSTGKSIAYRQLAPAQGSIATRWHGKHVRLGPGIRTQGSIRVTCPSSLGFRRQGTQGRHRCRIPRQWQGGCGKPTRGPAPHVLRAKGAVTAARYPSTYQASRPLRDSASRQGGPLHRRGAVPTTAGRSKARHALEWEMTGTECHRSILPGRWTWESRSKEEKTVAGPPLSGRAA